MKKHFECAAADWDDKPRHVELAADIGRSILELVQPTPEMDVLDYGCGTGLVGLFLLPHVRSVTSVDNSPAMLKVLNKKIRDEGLRGMRTMRLDLMDGVPVEERYHLIVSSMVAHHIADVAKMLSSMHRMLTPGGLLAIADLDAESGAFHSPDAAASVYHHGFDREFFKTQMSNAGFSVEKAITVHRVVKTTEYGEDRVFPVFLIIGKHDAPYCN